MSTTLFGKTVRRPLQKFCIKLKKYVQEREKNTQFPHRVHNPYYGLLAGQSFWLMIFLNLMLFRTSDTKVTWCPLRKPQVTNHGKVSSFTAIRCLNQFTLI